MKLIIQIPACNHEATLGATLDELPRQLPGFDEVEWLVIDDGSTDSTRRVAQARSVDHIVRMTKRSGLGAAYTAGVEACLDLGADVILTTTADRTYSAEDIPKLVAPILKGEADIVVGVRPIEHDWRLSRGTREVTGFFNGMLGLLGGTRADFASGFQAVTRDAASHLRITSRHHLVVETVLQAGYKGLVVAPVEVETSLRPRFASFARAAATMFRTAFCYRPFSFFLFAAVAVALPWPILKSPLYPALAAVFLAMGGVAHLVAINRLYLETISVKLDRLGDMVNEQQAGWGTDNPPGDYLGKIDASTEIH